MEITIRKIPGTKYIPIYEATVIGTNVSGTGDTPLNALGTLMFKLQEQLGITIKTIDC